ncbi:unnamed protein product [Rotaria sordida]|uniref:Uncharacterized protein n=1 Tax=Rotaria sordida TaxID=392033 RepID=A0A815SD42_9BILA|nr:unnamed protein product [Rotaria sordida]CAF1488150.1 unnamed protein product [Rotaria sordida]
MANKRYNNNISTNDDIQKRLKRTHQMVPSRKGRKNNEKDIQNQIEHNDDDEDDEEYDKIKDFQREQADETSSTNNVLREMSLQSMANSRYNENILTNNDIQQQSKHSHQMVVSRKRRENNEKEIQVIFILFFYIIKNSIFILESNRR